MAITADPAKSFLNQHSTDVLLASENPGIGIGFGFAATRLEVRNDAGVPVRFTLSSTGAASTDDAELRAGEALGPFSVPGLSGMGLTTTSTTTSTGLDAHVVRVRAWG